MPSTLVNLRVRHSDLNAIDNCLGSWLLREQGAPQLPATYFILGDVSHRVIDSATKLNLSQDDALALVTSMISAEIDSLPAKYLSTAAKTPDKLPALSRKIISNWYRLIHPDSPDRIALLRRYDWPPKSEVLVERINGTMAPAWSQIDTIFSNRNGGSLILDYKTSARDQASFRQIDYYRYTSKLPRAEGMYVNLLTGTYQVAPAYIGDRAVQIMVNSAVRAKERALSRPPAHTFKRSRSCKWCPFQDSCPAR